MDNLLQIGIVLTAIDKMSGVLTGAAEKATQGFARLQQKIKAVSATMTEMGTKATLMGRGILTALETPVKAFADLNEASTDLRVAMMDNLGQVPPQFAEINKQAVVLGNLLPGTTSDFVNSARALIENGTALDTVVGGGLKAASYLGVILKLPQAGAAEMVAKFREAFGLTENELVKMADLTQRAKFAFGLDPEEIKYAAQYAGSTLNNLKLTGIANTKAFLAMQGIARQKGMEGSVFGTNFSSMLNNIGMMEAKLGRNSKIMKEVNSDLAQAGIRLQFFDQTGNFVGLEKMVGELEKLKVLSDQQKLNVMNKIFGMEGGRVASMLSQAGVAGLHDYMGRMEHQADIMQRIDAITKSAKNTWEALTGTITNFWAAVGEPMVTSLYPLIRAANDWVGGPLMEWVAKHKELVKWLGLGAAAAGVLLVALGGLGIVAGAVVAGLAAVGGALGVVAAISWPLVLIVGAIAAAATWIITNWSPVKAFFRGLWYGFLAGLRPVMPALRQLGNALGWIGNKLKPVWDWFKKLLGPLDASTRKTGRWGVTVGRIIGWIATKFIQAYSIFFKFITLPARIVASFAKAAYDMYKAGGSFIDMLWAGMKAAAGKLYGGMKEIAAKCRAFWPFSPAKEGPLRDLHRVRIIETIASAVHPEPLVKAMGAAAAAGMLALAPLTNPAMALATATPPAMASHGTGLSQPALMLPALAKLSATPAMSAPAAMPTLPPLSLPLPPAPKPAPRLAPSAAAQSGAAAPVTIHFAPQITVQGGSGTAKDDIMAALKKHEHELVKLIEQVMARNARRQY